MTEGVLDGVECLPETHVEQWQGEGGRVAEGEVHLERYSLASVDLAVFGHSLVDSLVKQCASMFSAFGHCERRTQWFVVITTPQAHGLALLQGTSRVLAGYHFWSDVLVGAAVGSTLGLAIPYLHQRGVSEQVGFSVMPVPGGAAASLWLQPTGW